MAVKRRYLPRDAELEGINLLLDVLLVDPDLHELLAVADPVEGLLLDLLNLALKSVHAGADLGVDVVDLRVDLRAVLVDLECEARVKVPF